MNRRTSSYVSHTTGNSLCFLMELQESFCKCWFCQYPTVSYGSSNYPTSSSNESGKKILAFCKLVSVTDFSEAVRMRIHINILVTSGNNSIFLKPVEEEVLITFQSDISGSECFRHIAGGRNMKNYKNLNVSHIERFRCEVLWHRTVAHTLPSWVPQVKQSLSLNIADRTIEWNSSLPPSPLV